MERLQLLLAAAIMLSAGGGMAAYEWSRIRPLFGGSQVVTLYWCMYLSLIVLGFTTGIAAIVRGYAVTELLAGIVLFGSANLLACLF